jgi:hypothetical protein
MNTEEGAVHQNKGTKDPLGFVRKNELVQEVDGNSVVTTKGEQFLKQLKAAAGRSSPAFTGVLS